MTVPVLGGQGRHPQILLERIDLPHNSRGVTARRLDAAEKLPARTTSTYTARCSAKRGSIIFAPPRRKTVPTIQLVIIQGHREHIPSRQRAILLTKQKEHTYGPRSLIQFSPNPAYSAEIDIPAPGIDIADWLFLLPEAEYLRCCPPDHITRRRHLD